MGHEAVLHDEGRKSATQVSFILNEGASEGELQR